MNEKLDLTEPKKVNIERVFFDQSAPVGKRTRVFLNDGSELVNLYAVGVEHDDPSSVPKCTLISHILKGPETLQETVVKCNPTSIVTDAITDDDELTKKIRRAMERVNKEHAKDRRK